MASRNLILGFVITLIGLFMLFYLCFNFLLLTFAGYFYFGSLFEQFGIMIALIMILFCLILMTFCILGFAIKKLAKVFGIILLCMSVLMYGLILFFTFFGLTMSMPDELWPSIVFGSDGLCLIIVGAILYIISKE